MLICTAPATIALIQIEFPFLKRLSEHPPVVRSILLEQSIMLPQGDSFDAKIANNVASLHTKNNLSNYIVHCLTFRCLLNYFVQIHFFVNDVSISMEKKTSRAIQIKMFNVGNVKCIVGRSFRIWALCVRHSM